MGNNISENELKVLAYMHEHATGFTRAFPFTPSEVALAIGLETNEFLKAASYLQSHDLIGMHVIDASSFDGPAFLHTQMWLNGHGENFMRELERQPELPKRITANAVGTIYGAGREVIVKVLADFLGNQIPGV